MLFYLYLDRKQCRIALKQPLYLGRRHRVLKWAPFVRRIIFGGIDFRSLSDWLSRRQYVINVIWPRTAMKIKDCGTNDFRFITRAGGTMS